jgi:ABC-type lipoprotein release transport system permease subunit
MWRGNVWDIAQHPRLTWIKRLSLWRTLYDPWTFLGISCFLAVVAFIASLIPARHALNVEPMVALRYE